MKWRLNMKSLTNRLWIRVFIALALLAFLTVGCARPPRPVQPANNQPASSQPASDQPVDTATPPEIPPASTVIMDFGKFGSPKTSTDDQSHQSVGVQLVSFNQPDSVSLSISDAAQSNKNWNYAALNVGFWNVVLLVGLVVPVAAFVESFKHKAVLQPDYTWVWKYDVPIQGDIYSAELHGKYIDNGVRWDMYISKLGDYSDFHWYYGESNLPATEGFWILKNKPANPTDLLRIDWHRNLLDNTNDIKYTNIVPGGPENGGYIFAAVTTEAYDRLYEVYNRGKDNHTYIEWQYTTDVGRVKDTRFFNDSEWHCWNSAHYDVVCPGY